MLALFATHIALRVKPQVIKMAVPKRLFSRPSRSSQMRIRAISHSPQFVSTPDIRPYHLAAIGGFAGLMEAIFHFVTPSPSEEEPTRENPILGDDGRRRILESRSKAPRNGLS